MKTLHTNTKDAVKVSHEILQSSISRARPLLALITISQWEQMKHKDDVVVFDGADPEIRLEDFKDNAVVFSTYKENDEEYLLEDLGNDWIESLQGDWIRVAIGEWNSGT